MKRVFSGIKPTGTLHIGNYFGAIKSWLEIQNEYQCVFCVVDLHAITIPQEPKILQTKTMEVAKIYLTAGVDPKKSIIFIQSHIKEHAELTWILNTLVRIPELERMTQFKEKAAQHKKDVNFGLFDYPVLMAADILLYDTIIVPVGEDQAQHVELTRTLAKRFNQRFGETFVVPEVMIKKETARIMGLDNPGKKMSKDTDNIYNYIALTDPPDLIRDKIKKAVTDSGKEIIYRPDKPALANLLSIFSLASNQSIKELEKQYQGRGYAEFKKDLAEAIIEFLRPFQEKYAEFDKDDGAVLKILNRGAEQARAITAAKMAEVKKKIGLI